MLLKGSCHCNAVTFTVESPHPYPYNICYCSICRKTAGGGGYAINLSGKFSTLKVEGEGSIQVYQVKLYNEKTKESPTKRSFCKKCGSALWVWSPPWPELVHPFASAIDTELPIPPERTHLMLAYKAPWVELKEGVQDKIFEEYPNETIAQWHERLKLVK